MSIIIDYTSIKSIFNNILSRNQVNYELIIDNLFAIDCKFNTCINESVGKALLISYYETLETIDQYALCIDPIIETTIMWLSIWLLRYYIYCQYSIEFPLTSFPKHFNNFYVKNSSTHNCSAKEMCIIQLKEVITIKLEHTSPLFVLRVQQLLDSLYYNYPLMKKTKEKLKA